MAKKEKGQHHHHYHHHHHHHLLAASATRCKPTHLVARDVLAQLLEDVAQLVGGDGPVAVRVKLQGEQPAARHEA